MKLQSSWCTCTSFMMIQCMMMTLCVSSRASPRDSRAPSHASGAWPGALRRDSRLAPPMRRRSPRRRGSLRREGVGLCGSTPWTIPRFCGVGTREGCLRCDDDDVMMMMIRRAACYLNAPKKEAYMEIKIRVCNIKGSPLNNSSYAAERACHAWPCRRCGYFADT